MRPVERAIQRFQGIVKGDEIDWHQWLKPSDKSKVIPISELAELGKASALLGPEHEQGLTLPWEKFKGKVLIKPGKVCLWTGWTHHGKSAMVKQVMLNAVSQSERVLIASMEEEVLEIWRDLCVLGCGTSSASVGQIDEFIDFVDGMMWLYDQSGLIDPRRMQAVIRYAASELKVSQVVVDSLMMLAVDRDDYEAQSKFVGELKALAKDTGCTIHLVTHLRKRDGKTGEDIPGTIHDIAGGHEIASKADYVFNVWRDKANKDPSRQCVLKVEKQRGRFNWIGTMQLGFDLSSRQFIEGLYPQKFYDSHGEYLKARKKHAPSL